MGCKLTDAHISCLIPCIPFLQELNILWNQDITSEGYETLAKVIRENAHENENALKRLSVDTRDLFIGIKDLETTPSIYVLM